MAVTAFPPHSICGVLTPKGFSFAQKHFNLIIIFIPSQQLCVFMQIIFTVYQTGISSLYESTLRTLHLHSCSSNLCFIASAFHLHQFEFLNMASQLNGYRNFIDIQNKEGVARIECPKG
jgi:hypothetical protein